MTEWLVSAFLISGALFGLLAAVGVLRLPDLPTRMHASTKAGALAAMLIMGGVAVFFTEGAVVARAIAIIIFIVMTAPVAAHVIGRAGYFVGVPLWEGTVQDDLRDAYDQESHRLSSGEDGDSMPPRKEDA